MIKRILIILLLFPCLAWAGFSVDGVADPASVDGVTEPASVDGVSPDYTADANCMGAWFMNGNGTNETDRSGETETLTQTSGTIPTSATVPSGYSGTSRDFVASETEYLTHADAGSTDISGADQSLSITAWIKRDIDSGGYEGIVTKYDYTLTKIQYALWIDSNDKVDLTLVGESATGGTTINLATWYHVAVVYNDTDLRIYVNGSLDMTPVANSTGVSGESVAFAVGCAFDNAAPAAYFDGLIDEVMIFDRALSAAEVSNIYAKGMDGTRGGND